MKKLNNNARLTFRQVEEIREDWAESPYFRDTHKVIAQNYGVSRSTITKIINFKTWK
jgi:uncharacterized protein YjcR